MGSQQLLLIVLGVLLVALVIYSGVRFMGDYYQNFHREKLQTEIQNLHNLAVEYQKKATEYGGGSGSFRGWSIPESLLEKIGFKVRYRIKHDEIVYLAKSDISGWDSDEGIRIWIRYNNTGKTVRYLN